MRRTRYDKNPTIWLLNTALVTPFLYWGTILLSWAMTSGSSLIHQGVSELEMHGIIWAAISNAGVFMVGLAVLASAAGYFRALRSLEVGVIPSTATAGVIVLFAVSVVMAALFPLPSSLHGGKYLGFLIFLGPILLLVAVWRQPGAGKLIGYLVATTFASGAIFLLRFGMGTLVTEAPQGLFLRLDASVGFLWIGIAGQGLKTMKLAQ